MNRTIKGAALAMALTGIASSVFIATQASASIPTPTKGNVVVLSAAPRIVASPGTSFNAGETKTFQIAGKTFDGTAIPTNTTGVTLSVSSLSPQAAGKVTVWTTEAGRPGTPTVAFGQGESATNVASVGLNSDGKLNVYASVKTNVVIAITEYVVPVGAPAAPIVKTIAANEKTLENIGVSVKTECDCAGNGVTDLGKVTLDAGTYDVNVLGGFSGIKSSADLPAGTSIFGGLFLTKGEGVTAGFANVLSQNQGIMIPRSVNNATLTIDPVVTWSDTLTLTEATEVHISAYGYANDGVDHSALGVKSNVRSVRFVKVA